MGVRWVIVPLLAGTLGIVAAVGAFIGLLMVMGDEVGQPTEVDLKTRPPSFTLIGADAGDEWGRVALADVNGDGRDDLIAAAPKADGANNSRPDAGEAYIVFGPRSGTLDASQTQPDVVISGAEASDFLGRALAIGDLNGDGRDDVILGASADGPNNSRQDAGEVYVIMGSSAMPRAIDIAAGEQSVTVLGADAGDDAGKSVTAGDVNGDGMEDLIVGADDASGPGNSRPTAGEAYVIFGRRVLPGLVDIRTNEHDVTVLGAEGGDDLGQAVASGDLNGDGKGDLIVDADDAGGPNNGRTQAGEVYVIFGPLGGGKSVDIAAGEQQLTVFGADNGDNIGKDLSTGDVNGDGVEDIAIAAAAADGPSNARFKAGEVYIIFGAAGLSGSVDIRADEQDVKILGGEAADELGSSVSAQASFNSDDLADLLIGADDAGGPGNSRPKGGEAYVVYGSSSLPALIDVAQKAHPLAVFAADGGDDLGSFVAGGDLSGDGEADITIAAPGAAGPDNRRGKAGEIYTLNTGDPDGDSVLTFLDNCPEVRNADQADNDVDGVGDACESAGGAVPQSSGAAAGTGGQGGQVSRTGGDQRDGLRGGPGSGSGALSGSGRGAPAWAAAIVTLAAAGMLGGTAALVGRRRRSLRD